jgi:L-threonylcarbamoyladenylate synthase
MNTFSSPKILSVDESGITEAAEMLRAGHLVAFPTETVYGLGGDATNGRAVASIFAAKGRPNFNPLIIHVADTETAWRYVNPTPQAEQLAAAFWPGALTMVLPRKPDCPVSELVSAGLETLAVRVPSHPVARQLLELLDRPIAAPSANRSGRISPTKAAHVESELSGVIAAILDGGDCELGLESTVLGFTDKGPVILRPGGVTVEQIEAVLPLADQSCIQNGNKPTSPGQLSAHYAPNKPMRLEATEWQADEGLLAFGQVDHDGPLQNLSSDEDLLEAAANFYHMLRILDESEAETLAAMPIPDTGVGVAINDRLRRAPHDAGEHTRMNI